MSDFNQVMERIYEITGVRTQAGLADILDIAQPTVSDAKKRCSIPSKWYLKLFQKFGANPEWLESGTGHKYLQAYGVDDEGREIPVTFNQNGAGYGAGTPEGMRQVPIYSMPGFDLEAHAESDSQGSFCIPEAFDKPGLLVFRMSGSNMEPFIKRGALVGIDGSDVKIISGEVYGLVLPYEGMVVRRLYLEPEQGEIVLTSDSKIHAEKRVPLSTYADKIIGRAVWTMQAV